MFLHIFEMLFDCFISWSYMCVLKLFLGKYIFLQFFHKFQIFSVKRPDGSLLRPDGGSSDGVLHNLWPTSRRSELVLKRAQFLLYALCMRMHFCLCKHILNLILEMRDAHFTGLPFACLIMISVESYTFKSLNLHMLSS
jgi:hypothetical protein